MDQKVGDVMTRDVEAARSDMTIQDASRVMRDKNIGSLPVVEGTRVIGLVTDRDITVRAVADGKNPGDCRVREVMSRDVVCVREEDPLREAERLMHDRQLRRLPVVQGDGELVGYLAFAKVARSESPEKAGQVIQGVSAPGRPAPMKSRKKTG